MVIKLTTITRQTVAKPGGEAAWIRIVADQPNVKFDVIAHSDSEKPLLHDIPNIHERIVPPIGAFIDNRAYLEEMLEDSIYYSRALFINDVCGIHPKLNEVALSIAYQYKVPSILVVHEGHAIQCDQWIDISKKVDKILVFDEIYLKNVIPKKLRDKTIIVEHPVPYIPVNNQEKRKEVVLIIRRGDFKKLEEEIISTTENLTESGFEISIMGAYDKCTELKQIIKTELKCIEPMRPSRISEQVGVSRVAVFLRLPSGSFKTLFSSQLYESFNMNTPILAPRLDFLTMLYNTRTLVARFFDLFDEAVNSIMSFIENDNGDWRKRYKVIYERQNAKRWLEKFLKNIQ